MQKILILLIGLMSASSLNAKTLLILGDSLSAGYQMPSNASWPALLTHQFAEKGKQLTVINASVSGDTTAQGLQRLPKQLAQHKVDYVLIELGANDGLRGFSLRLIEKNLVALIDTIHQANANALLMQIFVPPNYGKRYTEQFAALYPKLSKQKNVPLLPFFLPLVINQPNKMLPDGLHPNQSAQSDIAVFMTDTLMPHLFPQE